MLSNDPRNAGNNPTEPRETKAQVQVLNPRGTIEVASTGGGTVTDPSAKDTKPPGVTDPDLSLLA